jgi:NAD(P)-dependent dehydrogenase (short-subunit alcohol dehydrogenase family)
MSLKGKTAVITGASGIVGSGIVHHFLVEGAKVIAPVRSEKGRQALLKDLEKLHYKIDIAKNLLILVLPKYATDNESMENLANEISYVHPEINHVVSCFGGDFEKGPASELEPDDVFDAVERAVPHLLLAQAFFPLLKEHASSSFTFITGMLGERCSMPNMAALTIANATAYGIIRAVEAEHADEPQRINELRIAALIRRDNQAGHPFIKDGHAYPASLIGNEAVAMATGKQNREINRIMGDYLATKEAEQKLAEVAVSE